MGWLKDQVTKLFNWLADKILRPVLNWLTEKIQWLIAEIKIVAVQAAQKIAEWMKNDYFFIGAIIVLIIGVIIAPDIAAWLAKMKAKLLASAFVKKVKELASIIKLDLILVNLATINSLFKVFWPEYRALMQSFSDALSAAAEMFGQGAGYLHSYLNLARGLAINTAGLLGLSSEAAEIEAYQRMSEYMGKVEARLRRYMHDPGLMMRDLIDEVIIPMSEDNMVVQGALVNDVREAHTDIRSLHGNVQGISDSITIFISEQPDAIREAFDERWEPIRTALQERLDFIADEVFVKMDEVITIFEVRSQRIEDRNDRIESKLEDPVTILGSGFLYGDDYLETYRDIVEDLATQNLLKHGMLFGDLSLSYAEQRDIIEAQFYRDLKPLPALSYEDKTSPGGIRKPPVNIPSPFIGDY